MQPSNQIWYLIARSLSGEASEEEEARLQDIMQQDQSLQQQFTILKSSWAGSQKEETHGTDAENKRISRILQLAKVQELLPVAEAAPRLHRRSRRRRMIIKVIVYAGISIVVVAGAILWLRPGDMLQKSIAESAHPLQVVATQNGSRTRTMLPDGTTVWLNAGSKISYDNDFAGATRDVKLEGEAYFDVTKNPHRPFIVHTGGIDIKVLGTVFNVRSYPEDKTVETTLIRGLVQVTRDGYAHQKPVFLHPNEKLVMEKGLVESTSENGAQKAALPATFKLAHLDSTINETERIETAWVYNRLEFRGDNFETLAGKLERWYNVSIVFEDDRVKQQTFNGSFENETVEQAFTALKTAAPFNFTIQGHEIRIRSFK
jgi:ferric-dicitrate binding protein FerR (iron transport regulator)